MITLTNEYIMNTKQVCSQNEFPVIRPESIYLAASVLHTDMTDSERSEVKLINDLFSLYFLDCSLSLSLSFFVHVIKTLCFNFMLGKASAIVLLFIYCGLRNKSVIIVKIRRGVGGEGIDPRA